MKPTVTSATSDFLVDENDTLAINISVTGIPPPSITWRKDDKILNDNGSNLVLSNAQHSDAGVYTLRAQNLAGTVQRSYNVSVRCKLIVNTMYLYLFALIYSFTQN